MSCDCEELSKRVEDLCKKVEEECIYPVDGSVIDVVNTELREVMGATNHHNNWQLAKKTKGETAVSKVEGITWQTGRTGRITPVINIKTINLSGADISNVTGHNAGNIINLNVGVGAQIEIVRSGEVIPKLLGVTKVGADAVIPSTCSSCNALAAMEKDFLVCQGHSCVAQVEARLLHFFNILGNVDLFGPRTISVLVENGICDLQDIYEISSEQLENMGFGAKQSTNLIEQLVRSRSESVEDWRLLAAFGIHHLGRGDSRKLLAIFDLGEIPTLTVEQIISIPGFGEITANSIKQSFEARWDSISKIIALGFNLQKDEKQVVEESIITGKYIVFTGSMESSREEMKERARELGANVQNSVNKKTDILVAGAKVGAKKIDKARDIGTKIYSEIEYMEYLGSE